LDNFLTKNYPLDTKRYQLRVETILKKNMDWNGLLPDEIRSLSYYTSDMFYRELNNELHHRRKSPLELDLTARLLTAANKCPRTSPGKVYRGLSAMQVTADAATQYVEGKYVIWVSFASCSRKISVAEKFCKGAGPRTLFEIYHLSGVDIAPISVCQPPWSENEDETFLTPNIVFKVEKVTTVGDLDTITLREIPEKDLLCLMEFSDPTAEVRGDDTPWTTSLAFLKPEEVKM